VVTGFSVIESSGEVTELTEQHMEQNAQAQANDLNTEMATNKQIATSLAATMEAYEKGDASREEVNQILKKEATTNPDVLGVYVAYEPNAFDGEDATHVNGTGPGSNDDGRFAPYWSRFDGSLSLAALNDLESQDWYTRPVEEQQFVIKGPFVFDGVQMLSFLAPIKRDGEVVGVAGVDVSVNYWQNQTEQADVAGNGYAFIATEDGRLVAHPNEDAIGELTLADIGERNDTQELVTMQEQLQSRDSGNFSMTDPVTGEQTLVQYQSVETGEVGDATVVTKSTEQDGVTALRNKLLGVSAIALLVLIGVILVGTRRITRPIRTLTDKAAAIEDGEYKTELETNRGDEIGALYGSLSSMRDSLVANINEAEEASERAEAARQEATEAQQDAEQAQREAEEVNEHLQEKASSFSATMSRAAEGDFTQRMNPDSQNEAMTEIAEAFNEMIEELEETISQIRSFADEVAASSEEVAGSSKEIERASKEVAESVEEISRGTDTQKENLQQVAGEMNDMSATVEEIASSAEEVAATATTTAEKGQTGREQASQATAEIQAIEERADEVTTRVETLETEMTQIGEVVDMIAEIAEQTNMLALNASIEAARAGEAGEGFAVVADEIKSLATEAAEATTDIENRIQTVQATTTQTVDGIQQMSDRVKRGRETIEESIEMFDEIADAVQEVERGITEISESTDDQAASSEEVVSMVDEVSTISEQTAQEASNVSAATEEQTASLSEASAKIQDLSALSQSLQEQVADFETNTDTAQAPGERARTATHGGR
jgi:methyl-accepting chemotaxis protein